MKANWPISRDARRPVSAKTAAKEWSALKSRILPGLGHLRISEITDVSVEDFSAELLRQGLSNSTVNSRLWITRKVLAHARRRGKIPAPALDSWPCPLEEKELHQEMSPDEVGRFLRAFDSAVIKGGAGGTSASLYYTERFRWARPYFVLAIHLGLARGDLKNLRWTNVDLSRNLVQVERALLLFSLLTTYRVTMYIPNREPDDDGLTPAGFGGCPGRYGSAASEQGRSLPRSPHTGTKS